MCKLSSEDGVCGETYLNSEFGRGGRSSITRRKIKIYICIGYQQGCERENHYVHCKIERYTSNFTQKKFYLISELEI